MKSVLAAAAAALAAGAAFAAPPPAAAPADPVGAFEAAMAKDDSEGAARAIDPLIDARRRKDMPLRPDPLLSGLVGRMYLPHAPGAAEAFLAFADGPGVPPRQRALAGLGLAAAREAQGETDAALAALAKVDPAELTAEERGRVAVARARLLLTRDPAAARAAAAAVQEAGPALWEAELVAAEAASLLGDPAAARAAAARAWAAAGEARPQDYAPVRVAAVRAALAAAAGDTQGSLAMLNAAGAARAAFTARIAELLPVCGEAGLTGADEATFAVVAGPERLPQLIPVAASRPLAARRLFDALAGAAVVSEVSEGLIGDTLRVRCRTAPSAAWDPPARGPEPVSTWFASRGLYATLRNGDAEALINDIGNDVERLSASLGDDHPALIPLHFRLAELLRLRAQESGDVEAWQVERLLSKAAAGMAATGGAEGLYETDAQRQEDRRAAAATDFEQGLALVRAVALKRLGEMAAPYAYPFLMGWLGKDKTLPDATKRLAIETVAKGIADPADPRRRTLDLLRLRLDAKSDPAAAARDRRALALPPDVCAGADADIDVKSHPFTDETYAAEALRYSLQGASAMELTLDAGGRVTGHRILVSAPAGLFDEEIAKAAPVMELTPPVFAGKPRGCRGYVQTVTWKMPPAEPAPSVLQAPQYRQPGPKEGT
jgi:hypothetical protein